MYRYGNGSGYYQNGRDSGANQLQIKLPADRSWCINRIEARVCSRPGPPKITSIDAVDDDVDARALSTKGGQRVMIKGMNLGPNIRSVTYGPPPTYNAYVAQNCTGIRKPF